MKFEELLPVERIALNVEAKDWQEAIRAVGSVMVATGVVEERYIDGMIATTKELGPYIVIAPGVAIPHSRPEDGVISPCLAYARLTPPINFGNKENDPVHILFALGAPDHSQHVDALKQIAEILSDQDKFEQLLKADTVEAVTAILYNSRGSTE
ncbi:MAG TPA: PTS sugar transporter subunit IIA [Anaerolineales bacterium]|jgi:mannitol/fructose-specific phosphotransferase system IIA component (Ntr-type)|nr:PTS sugar transporter subunit IIA [Anaerolineales bacterium]